MHGKDEQGNSQWAVLTDPKNAAFGFIPVVDPESVNLEQARCGKICWLTLASSDAAKSRDFYQQVVGWQTGESDSNADGARSEMKLDDGTIAAGIQQGEATQNVPTVWIVHVPVDDLVTSLQRVKDSGGEVLWENTGDGTAIIRDPVSVCFRLCEG